jgi:translocator protein
MIPQSPFYAALLGGAVFCVVLAIAGGVLTQIGPWYESLQKPTWKPPDWAFGPTWTIIFAFIAFAIAYAWEAADSAQRAAMLWTLAINGVLNIAWSGIFFTLKNPGWAMAELVLFWLSIVALIYVMGSIDRSAGLLLVPYLMWVTAAGILNYQIVRMNPA